MTDQQIATGIFSRLCYLDSLRTKEWKRLGWDCWTVKGQARGMSLTPIHITVERRFDTSRQFTRSFMVEIRVGVKRTRKSELTTVLHATWENGGNRSYTLPRYAKPNIEIFRRGSWVNYLMPQIDKLEDKKLKQDNASVRLDDMRQRLKTAPINDAYLFEGWNKS
jgi:hypothetical protein